MARHPAIGREILRSAGVTRDQFRISPGIAFSPHARYMISSPQPMSPASHVSAGEEGTVVPSVIVMRYGCVIRRCAAGREADTLVATTLKRFGLLVIRSNGRARGRWSDAQGGRVRSRIRMRVVAEHDAGAAMSDEGSGDHDVTADRSIATNPRARDGKQKATRPESKASAAAKGRRFPSLRRAPPPIAGSRARAAAL